MRYSTVRLPFTVVIITVALALAGCSPGGVFSGDFMYAPHRQLEIGPDTFVNALNALSEGDRAGEIVLTEAEFTSLMDAFFVDKNDNTSAIKELQVWFEPDTVYAKLLLREGAVPGIPTDTALNLEGSLRTEDSRLHFDIERGGIGVFGSLSPILISSLEEELDKQIGVLFDRTTPLDVKVDSGKMTILLPEY